MKGDLEQETLKCYKMEPDPILNLIWIWIQLHRFLKFFNIPAISIQGLDQDYKSMCPQWIINAFILLMNLPDPKKSISLYNIYR